MAWPVGKSAAQAVEVAVKKINAEGGILGRTVELIQEDSKGQVPIAVETYRKLVITDGVSMVVVGEMGALTIACQKAGAELFREYPHIMMNAAASAEDLPKAVRENYDAYKFFFNLYTTAPDRFIYGAWVQTYLTEKQIKPKPKKVAILGEDLLDYNPYWQGWPEYGFPPYPDVVYKDRGIDVVYTAKIAVGEKMFLPIFEKIAASGAEYIDFHMSAYSDFYILAKQWAASPAKDIPFMHSGVSPKYWDATGGACLGMIGTWPSDWLDYEVVGKTREYLKSFNETYGYSGSNWLAMGAYDSTLFWAAGVQKARTPDAQTLIKTLEKLEIDCARGRMKVNPIDHTAHNYPYKSGAAEATVKAIVEGHSLADAWKKLGMFPYGIYPYGPIAPLSQWQDNGKLVMLHPPEVAEKTNPGVGYVSPKELRQRSK
jgi:branched-chain amino acid transport system substrate-binding protein